MRFIALASDYDNTLATNGRIDADTLKALERLRNSGRQVILVTGRDIDDLCDTCDRLDLFSRVVAENGGVLYRPATRQRRLLAPAPPAQFVQALRARGVTHLGVSATLVATVKPHEKEALEVIRDLGFDLHVVFNGDAVMILCAGVTKASGLAAALEDLVLSPHNVVGIGDAANDHPLLDYCEFSVAVANAIPMLKAHADFVTSGERGQGVAEVIEEWVTDDLSRHREVLGRHGLLLGRQRISGADVRISPYGTVALISGPSGSGKSTVTTGLLERLAAAGYQFCVLDPEGDYGDFGDAVVVGNAQSAAAIDDVAKLLRQPGQRIIVNMMRVPLSERPVYCAALLSRLHELRITTGRPHWIVFEEAHHLLPADWGAAQQSLPLNLETALAITVHPDQVSPALLMQVNTFIAVGATANEALQVFARSTGQAAPNDEVSALAMGDALLWQKDRDWKQPHVVSIEPARSERRRHVRKYAEGMLIPERCFFFRGPEQKLNLRAHNLVLFLELANGVDDETWLYHLRRGDYSRWFRDEIRDDELATEAREIESLNEPSASQSRQLMQSIVERRYTQSDNPCLPRLLFSSRGT
jgi:hydroxymethylpyrimidine pyrophosphatase-like HAD family hydrolase